HRAFGRASRGSAVARPACATRRTPAAAIVLPPEGRLARWLPECESRHSSAASLGLRIPADNLPAEPGAEYTACRLASTTDRLWTSPPGRVFRLANPAARTVMQERSPPCSSNAGREGPPTPFAAQSS